LARHSFAAVLRADNPVFCNGGFFYINLWSVTNLFDTAQQAYETHQLHGRLFLGDSGSLDRQHILDTFRWLNSPELFAEAVRLFNSNLGIERVSHAAYREWLKHLRSWLGTRPKIELPVIRPELRKTERELPAVKDSVKEKAEREWREVILRQFQTFKETGNIALIGATGLYKAYVDRNLIKPDTYLRFVEEAKQTVIADLKAEAMIELSKRHRAVSAIERIKSGNMNQDDEGLIMVNCKVKAIIAYYEHLIKNGKELKIS
jgi:hypothetical protein